MSHYYEDIVPEVTHELGCYTFSRESVVAFASEYDPQVFHLGEEAGRDSMYGAMTASGWQTTSVWLRMLIDERNREADMMRFRGERPARYGPSPGFEQLKWIKPVFVGDTVRFTTRIIEKRDSKSRPQVGLVMFQNEGYNQHGVLVFSLVSKMFVERRVAYAG
jgi:acyl dehydratase